MPKAIVANTLAYERDVECLRLWEQRGPGTCGSCSNHLTVNTSNEKLRIDTNERQKIPAHYGYFLSRQAVPITLKVGNIFALS
jgi:hypothetical protein